MPPATQAPTTMGQRQIRRAKELLFEQRDLQKEIDATRKFLRMLRDVNELTDAEKGWVDAFHPDKEKGVERTDAQIKRTQEVRAAALKEIGDEQRSNGSAS